MWISIYNPLKNSAVEEGTKPLFSMAKLKLLKTLDVSPGSNQVDFNFEEGISGRIVINTEEYEDNTLPDIIKIILNTKDKISVGGYLTLPKRKSAVNERNSFFRQSILANNLKFLSVKIESKKEFTFRINFCQDMAVA